MDNVKKAILYHWMNAIFVRKTLPKTDFNTNNAVEVLKEAGIIVPKNKETESYLKTATNDFRAALKESKVEELLKQFPLPSLVTEEGKDIEMESDVEEPSASEVKVTVYDFLNGKDLNDVTEKTVLKHLKSHFGMSLKHRKDEVKKNIESFLSAMQAEKEEEEEVIVPKKKSSSKGSASKDEFSALRATLRKSYWELWNKLSTVRSKISLERGFLVNSMTGEVDKEAQAKITVLKGEEKELLERFLAIDEELYNLPGVSSSEIADEPSAVKKEEKKGGMFKFIGRPTLPENNDTKENLKYFAFLTYYAISPLITVEEPTLEFVLRNYPDITVKFRTDFLNLPVKDRFKFISSIIGGRKFKTINSLIEKGEPLNPSENGIERGVDVSLGNFVKEHSEKNAEDEIKYNFMAYVQPNLDYPLDIIVKNVTTEIMRVTKDTDAEGIRARVEKALGSSSERKMIAEKVHTEQLKHIKEFLKEKYSSLYTEDPEEQTLIQGTYNETRPPITIPDISLTSNLPTEDMIKYVPEMKAMKSELDKLVKTFKNTKNKNVLYEVKNEVENKLVSKSLKKSERTQEELEIITKKLKSGEISQQIADALTVFIKLYDTISNLPTKTSDENIFEFNRLEHLPEKYRPEVEKMLRQRISESMAKSNAFLAKEKDILNKLQIEVDRADKIDTISVAEKINQLETSEEVKNKLLRTIEKEGKINVFTTYRKLNNIILMNPLEYRGIRRAQRVNKAVNVSEIDKIKAQFPKKSHTIDYCLTYLFTKPWLNLPKSYGYFLANPNDLEKEMLDIKERFLFGGKISPSKDFKAYENIYIPTTTFWKVYCTEFLVYRDGMYSCNNANIERDFLNINSNKYVLGVYDKETNSDFRIFTKEDFDKECAWFENNDMGSLTTIDKYSSIDLNLNVKLARVARDNIRNKIKAVLTILYQNKNRTNNMIDRDTLKLEQELFNQCETNGKRVFFVYVYESLFLLYLIDPASPLYEFTSFFQQLFLTSRSYDKIVELSKRLYDAVPTLYLLPNPQKTVEIISEKVKYDTNNTLQSIRTVSEPGFKTSTKKSSVYISDNDVSKEFHSFDPKRFKNVCSNYNEVQDPYMIAEHEGKLICVGKKQIYNILNDNADEIASIPEGIKRKVKYLLSKNNANELNRLFTMEYIAKDFLSNHYLYVLKIKDNDNILEDSHIKEAIELLTTQISGVADNEKVIFIDHIIAEAYNTLLRNIKLSIDNYEVSEELTDKLIEEAKSRKRMYQSADLFNNDRDERKKLLASLFNYLENLYGELDDDIKDIVVDYFSVKYIPEVEAEKQTFSVANSGFYNCSICYNRVKTNLQTYLYSKGKKELAHFCSMKCFKQLSEDKITKDIGKEDIKQIETNILIDKVIAPIKLTYEELIHRTKLMGMSLPEGIPFEQAYVSWLANPSFADKIWLEYNHVNIDTIARKFNIHENDVATLWAKLKEKPEFYSIFIQRLESIAKPYSKYQYMGANVETYNDDCPYAKPLVQDFLQELAGSVKELVKDVDAFSFEEIVFKPFFIAFSNCAGIQTAVKDAKVSSSNILMLNDIIAFYGFPKLKDTEYALNETLRKTLVKHVQKERPDGINVEELKANPLEYIKSLLLKNVNIPSDMTFEKVMDKDISGKNAPYTVRTRLAQLFQLPIETGSFRVESYKNLLTIIGMNFISAFLNFSPEEPVSNTKYQKRKPTSLTRKVNALDARINSLKEKSIEIITSQSNIKNELASSTDSVKTKELEQQLKSFNTQFKAIEEQINEATDDLNRTLNISSAPKKVAKKGLFVKGAKPSKGAEAGEAVEPKFYDRTETEKVLKHKLLLDIANRFPDGSNLYNVALTLNILPLTLTKDVLTKAMITSGKYSISDDELTMNKVLREEQRKEEELDLFAEELEKEFESMGELGTSKEGEEEREVVDEDAEMYVDDIEDEDALEDNYEREGEEGEFY